MTKIRDDTNDLDIKESENITKVTLKDVTQSITFSFNFKIEWVTTQMVTTPLSAKIRGGSCREPGTCELLLMANRTPRMDTVYFAATSGHLFIERDEMKAFDSGRVPIEEQSEELNKICCRYQATTIFGRRPDSALNASLQLRPLIGYQTHSDGRRVFMSDITLLPLNTIDANKLFNMERTRRLCKFFNSFVKITQQSHIDIDMLDLDQPIHERRNPPIVLARDRRGHVVERRGSPAHSQLGLSLAFVLEHG